MKRLTYEFVKEQFEKEGWILLTTEYKNCEQKLDCICSRGHKHSISYHNWKNGWRCPYCYGNVKKDIEFIRSDFEKNGYIFLTEEYINSYTKLRYKCPQGHEHSISWNNWKKGARCSTCANKNRGLSARLNFDFVKLDFEKDSYILLTTEYINSKQKLEYVCPNGHRHSISWSDWKQGKRCPTCRYLNRFGSGNPSWKGGISCEPYCDVWRDKEFKESIKERDNYQCQNPDCWGKNDVLTIHHIDYNKKNCRPENLITLCNSCNSRANKDRERHKDFYSIIIKKKYNFKEV
jgi:hypothetical protein